ncbi:MAG: site-specific DNA-methyltransferase, partial [Bacillota bacterium]
IQLYSFAGDVVLDPFCGSGTTCVAALLAGRRYVGYDIKPEYVELARRRIAAAEAALARAASGRDGHRQDPGAAGAAGATP